MHAHTLQNRQLNHLNYKLIKATKSPLKKKHVQRKKNAKNLNPSCTMSSKWSSLHWINNRLTNREQELPPSQSQSSMLCHFKTSMAACNKTRATGCYRMSTDCVT